MNYPCSPKRVPKEMYEGVSRQGNALYNYVNELAKKDGVEMMVRLDNSVQARKNHHVR